MEERDHLGAMILQWTLHKQDMKLQTALNCMRTVHNGKQCEQPDALWSHFVHP